MLLSFPVTTVRVFIAISLPGDIHDNLSVASACLKDKLTDGVVRWVKVDNIHLTLKFLGEIPETDIVHLKNGLDSPIGGHSAFELTVEKIGVFPNPQRPRIIWAGLRHSLELEHLQNTVEQVTHSLGYAADARDFSAHLTLGRINQTASPQQLLQVTRVLSNSTVGGMGDFIVKSIDIYRSQLNAGGSIYTKLHSIPLSRES
jgi:2'-5' RNA ligase